MKSLKKIMIIFIMVFSIFCVKSFAKTGTINVNATRLRKENNTTSEILTNIYEDDEVEIIEEFGEWVKVKYKKNTGYIKKEFVTIKENKKEETKKDSVSNYENTDTISTTTKLLEESDLKLMPSFMAKQVAKMKKGTTLTIISQMNQWVKVTDGKIAGWVLKTKFDSFSSSQVNPSDLATNSITNVTNNNKTNTITNGTDNSNVENNTNTIKNTDKENTTDDSKSNTTTNQSTMTSVSKKGKVNVETANVRKEPNTSAKRIAFLDEGDVVTITEETEEWYKVEHGNIVGYVSKKLITITSEGAITSRSKTEERNKETSTKEENTQKIEKEEKNIQETTPEILAPKETEKVVENTQEAITKTSGNNVVEYAKQYLGCSYVLGGKTPESGFDCSGFTRYVYKNFGYQLASVSYEQTSVGVEVTRENLQPGDLIFFYNDGKTKIGHTGIYVGNGDFIHAANPERGVVYDNINEVTYYNERFVTARRIVK